MATLDDIHVLIETRLSEVLSEADRLRAVLAALGGPEPVRAPANRSSPREEQNARDARRSTRNAPRGSVRSGVVRALSGGKAMTAGEIAAAAGLRPTTVSTTLARLAAEGVVRKASRGYERAAPPETDPTNGVEDAGLQALRAELRAGLRTPTTR